MKNIWPCIRNYYLHVFQAQNERIGDNYFQLMTLRCWQSFTFSPSKCIDWPQILYLWYVAALLQNVYTYVRYLSLEKLRLFLSLLYLDHDCLQKIIEAMVFIENICFTLSTILGLCKGNYLSNSERVIKILHVN